MRNEQLIKDLEEALSLAEQGHITRALFVSSCLSFEVTPNGDEDSTALRDRLIRFQNSQGLKGLSSLCYDKEAKQ